MTGGMIHKTVQVHLNRICNLSCLHCYSRSGPAERESIDPAILKCFLTEAREQGYMIVAFSGGEPFLYPEFAETLLFCQDIGFINTVITNATLLRHNKGNILQYLDFAAVSVDGPEQVHNTIRRSQTAFSRMRVGLDVIKDAGIRFGIAHTVSRESLPYLPWMAEFSCSVGAEVLQLHPLGVVGAAVDHAIDVMNGEVLARTYLAALALRDEYKGSLHIHIDLFNLEQIKRNRQLIIPQLPARPSVLLSEIINPLVLLSNGLVSPVSHGLNAKYAITNLYERSFSTALAEYFCRGLPELHDFCSEVAGFLFSEPDPWPYVNWYETLERQSIQ
jgi:Fe-coproporphyrin III synthase